MSEDLKYKLKDNLQYRSNYITLKQTISYYEFLELDDNTKRYYHRVLSPCCSYEQDYEEQEESNINLSWKELV